MSKTKRSPYKPEQRETTLEAAVADALSEIESLRDEMQEMDDNMSGANMEHLPKYEVVSTALQELEEHCDQSIDVPEWAQALSVKYMEMVNRRRGRGPSRDVRLGNATAMLGAAIEAIDAEIERREKLEDDDLPEGEAQVNSDRKTDMEELRAELDEHADFSVEFPGMYG